MTNVNKDFNGQLLYALIIAREYVGAVAQLTALDPENSFPNAKRDLDFIVDVINSATKKKRSSTL